MCSQCEQKAAVMSENPKEQTKTKYFMACGPLEMSTVHSLCLIDVRRTKKEKEEKKLISTFYHPPTSFWEQANTIVFSFVYFSMYKD